MQLEVSSQLTVQGDATQTTLQAALCRHSTKAFAPTLKSQLEPLQTMLAFVAPTTSHVAPLAHVASQTSPQLPAHEAVVQTRWHVAPTSVQPAVELQPQAWPSGHAQTPLAQTQSAAAQVGPLAE